MFSSLTNRHLTVNFRNMLIMSKNIDTLAGHTAWTTRITDWQGKEVDREEDGEMTSVYQNCKK